ncbi:hypothetical protein [Aliarcobacter butzleri]|uniref:hypothetical protein n=1 Tax=Aliarcobacter butzleri TaxID=28197 RepID=UPI0021B53487|nr:hypothetical protein [Aliarcobacter butzleri]MCT7571270.1 hypothetical protein [Aliarcobacter butzleri]
MRKTKNSSRDLISTLPSKLNQKLIDGYRVKLFSTIKDSLDKDRTASLNKEELEFKKWLEDKSFNILKPINNLWFSPMLRA